MKIIDLTHPISNSMPVYFPWHPETRLERTANYEDHKCIVTRVSVGTHSGTHIDAPSHVLKGKPTIDQYEPRLWYTRALVLDFTPREAKKAITADEIRRKLKDKGLAVILKTGWDVQFGTPDYYATYPPLSNEAAEVLGEWNVPVIASDTPYTLDVHYICLGRGIPLITNINNTAQLKEGIVTLIAAPLLIKDGDGAPARVFAVIE
ncbi:MAG: cyclase family protein [Ignavibacterium sp.]|jgi:kynurenine formamidase